MSESGHENVNIYFARKEWNPEMLTLLIYFTNKSNCILCIMAVNCHLQESMSVCIWWNGIFHAFHCKNAKTKHKGQFESIKKMIIE